MMATGDLKGCLRKLEVSLRSLKYPREVNYQGLARGDPSSCLPIVSYAFISYSSAMAEHLVGFGVELTGANDLRFIDCVYKVLRDLFHYKPLLTKQQFLQFGFAERKICILCDIVTFVIDKHKELTKGSKPISQPKRRPRFQAFHSNSKSEDDPPQSERQRSSAMTVPQSRALVQRHMGGTPPTQCSLSSDEPDQQEEEEEEREEEEEESSEPEEAAPQPTAPTDPAVEARLQAVEAQLQQCHWRLGKMTLLEHRLEVLERDMAGKIVIDRSQWENLESRVLLLETRLALDSVQNQMSVNIMENVNIGEKASTEEIAESGSGAAEVLPHNPSVLPQSPSVPPSATHTHLSAPTTAPEENIKERLERIANMMKDTSSLLRSVEPPI